jgi:hypothetical protein
VVREIKRLLATNRYRYRALATSGRRKRRSRLKSDRMFDE